MLDQNTDRMWYVIGAVIIGAAIILIMNSTFPQLFATVGETFDEKTEQTTEVVDGILPNTRPSDNVQLIQDLLKKEDIQVTGTTTIDVSEFDESGTVHIVLGTDQYAGIRFLARDLAIKPDTNYVFRYEYQKTSGELESFGGHTHDIFRNNEVFVNGEKRDLEYMDAHSAFVDNSTSVQQVEVHFTTPSVLDYNTEGTYWENVHESIAIQPNRESTTPVNVSIYHLTLVEEVK